MVRVGINFRFRKNAQTGSVTRSAEDLAQITSQIILEDVAFAVAGYEFDKVKTTMKQKLTAEIGREMDHMVNLISTMMNPRDGATAPVGDITNLAGSSPMTAQEAGVNWSQRSLNYLRWKVKHNKPDNWWKLSGRLQEALGKSAFYTTNFGPIKIDVVRKTQRGRDARGRFTSRPLNVSGGRNTPENITSLGMRGRPSVYYSVATITVTVFGRITAEMLPSLASARDDPRKLAAPDRNGARVIDLIRNKDIRNKLGAAPRGEYRQLLDPFLSYYLTRAVPVRVNRVIETTLQRTGDSRSASRLG